MKQRLAHLWYVQLRPPLQRFLARILRVLPISSRRGGVPKGVIWDAAEWIREAERSGSAPGHWQVKVRAAEWIAGPPPQSLDPEIPAVFESYRRRRFPELSVTCIRSGRVATSEGTVIAPDDRVFDQFVHQWGDPIGGNKVFHLPGLGRIERKAGSWATLVVPASIVSVGHYLMDGVLRLSVLEAAGLADDVRFIVPNMQPKYVQPLEALGYPAERCGGLQEGHWEVERLLVPSYLSAPGYIRPWAAGWIRDRLGVERSRTGTRRLWISRGRARNRRLQNEDEIFSILAPFGFEKVELESMSFREQVDRFAQAETVAGPHGAGMTNLMFAPRGARVLELFPAVFVNPVFYSMANSVDQEYYYLIGSAQPVDWNPEGQRDLDHFSVDPARFRQTLQLMRVA
jgi:hypothetical protein